MKTLTFISFLSFVMAAFANGQTQQQVRNRIEGTERPDVTKQLSSSKKGSSSDSSNPSDSGAQRPVILKKKRYFCVFWLRH